MREEDFKKFMTNAKDFGKEPIDKPLSAEEYKLTALAMAVNAALIQFVNEGVLAAEQQIHFMMHVQDFSNRLFDGEVLKLENTYQSLAVDSAAGRLYQLATEEAFKHGSENYARLKEIGRQQAEDRQQNGETFNPEEGEAHVSSKPTLH